jgi:cell division protein DivIC
MAKKRIKKSTKRRLTIFGTLSIIVIIYFLVSTGCQVYNLYKLNIQKNELQVQYKKLKDDAEELKIQINQLHDPEYLAKYARENYSYSKEGEYIIKLNEKEEKIKKINHSINKEYIVLGLSGFIILIFIYIIGKGLRKK